MTIDPGSDGTVPDLTCRVLCADAKLSYSIAFRRMSTYSITTQIMARNRAGEKSWISYIMRSHRPVIPSAEADAGSVYGAAPKSCGPLPAICSTHSRYSNNASSPSMRILRFSSRLVSRSNYNGSIPPRNHLKSEKAVLSWRSLHMLTIPLHLSCPVFGKSLSFSYKRLLFK